MTVQPEERYLSSAGSRAAADIARRNYAQLLRRGDLGKHWRVTARRYRWREGRNRRECFLLFLVSKDF